MFPSLVGAVEPTESASQVLSALDYPELQVVPRASERLQMAAQSENERGWLSFWPLQLSALATLYSGHSLSGMYRDDETENGKDDLDFRAKAALGIGVGWIGISTYYMFTRPYTRENDKLKNQKPKDKREQLFKERMAEEALEKPAQLAKILTWASFFTNVSANLLLVEKSTPAQNLYPVIGLIAAGLPFVFGNQYITNYEKHLEYKRKIYAPVSYLAPHFNTQTAKLEPRMVLQWSF